MAENQDASPCPHCGKPLCRRRGPKGSFWGCTEFPTCRGSRNDDRGAPAVRQ
ncbi:MAG: topoisomerase DNA-binding C4 zinc finger domain-containing protein [Acidiferrobacterales bacterium]